MGMGVVLSVWNRLDPDCMTEKEELLYIPNLFPNHPESVSIRFTVVGDSPVSGCSLNSKGLTGWDDCRTLPKSSPVWIPILVPVNGS